MYAEQRTKNVTVAERYVCVCTSCVLNTVARLFFLLQHLLGGLCPAPSIVFSSVCCVLHCVVYSMYGVLNVVSSVVTSVWCRGV